jgi:hypothetical protein
VVVVFPGVDMRHDADVASLIQCGLPLSFPQPADSVLNYHKWFRNEKVCDSLLLMISGRVFFQSDSQDFLTPPGRRSSREQSDPELEESAMKYASVLVSWGRLSHLGPDGRSGRGKTPDPGLPSWEGWRGSRGLGPDRQTIWECLGRTALATTLKY